ncbi:CBS domain-containing protein [Parvularcula sp. ZS-1/3]|uniref:CBS domain-containing protein n=1 Tax=Parvularcula mediterranea TaxID=2732508 RepID=A0A7Y3RKG6_9PROT|nr:CBS domain-containing protein [Parvularcula mediterranea]NNU15734.1 CBS domain-containing protein [Parvularcula mediterranea]
MIIRERPEYQQKQPALQFPPTTSVSDAVAEMSKKNFGASAVVDESGHLVGIFTERDLMRRVVAQDKDPRATTLADVMTTELKVAKPTDNLIDWLRLMSNERFRHLPVQEEAGGTVVMMSQGDFVSYTWPELLHRVGEQARASLGGKYYPYFIGGAVLIYTVLLIALT